MSRLPASLGAPQSGRARPVWFDAAAYGRVRLLLAADLVMPFGRCSATSRPVAPRRRRCGSWPLRAGLSRWS